MTTPVRILGACVALGVSLSGCSKGAARQDSALSTEFTCGPVTVVAMLPESIREASGIARDPRRDDLFWLHNDGENETVLFGVDTTGALLTTARVPGVTNRDIEDIAIGRCGPEFCVYLGDIGDNRARYPSVLIHRIPLPALPGIGSDDGAVSEVFDQVLSPLSTWELDYPDGPRDAEGLVIDDARGQLSIFTKGRRGEIVLFSLDLAELEQSDGSTITLRRIGRLTIPIGGGISQLVTAADLSPDGTRLAVRSYASLYLLPWSGADHQDTAAVPYTAPLFAALEPQGEGVAWATDGEVLYLASEGRAGRPPQLSRIRCQSR